MLSRVADNLYWLARYLERTENLARLVGATTNLMLDLPRHLAPGWQPLVKITGSELIYSEREDRDFSEKSIVRFLIADVKYGGSMVSSIARAREIARTARDIMPREFWERINALHLYVGEQATVAIDKFTRHAFLERVTGGVQQLIGMLEGVVSEGEALSFLSLGRNIERADMTSRIVDVRAAALPVNGSAELRPFETVLWMSVLRSLSGYQMYRMHARERVHGVGVVRFLLADEHFPRACVCCLHRAEEVLHSLPHSEPLVRWLSRTRRVLTRARLEGLDQIQLHEFIDRFQLSLARWNDELARIYFLGEIKPSATAGT
ncbi:MAG: alpha-E domain-containing protein [Steroidobacteraceae bacterium]|jgi:uncharacterized alpha-E superfamily protein